MTDAIRTVVLARAGAACDRVVEGLVEAGAELVGTLDPAQHAPDALEALAPSVLVVVLEPADEDVLDAFEPAFAAPGRTVIFEEAALVLERTGWDAARWVRHLGAKLRGLGDVLPPSASADATPVPVADPDTAAFELPPAGEPLVVAPVPLEFDANADAGTFAAPDVEHAPVMALDPDVVAPLVLEFDANADVSPSTDVERGTTGDEATAPRADTGDTSGHLAFDPVAAEFDDHAAAPSQAVEFDFNFELAEYDEMSYTPPAEAPGEVRDLDENLAALSDASPAKAPAPAPAPVVPPPLPPSMPERVPLSLQDDVAPLAPSPVAPPAAPAAPRMSLSLVDEDADATTTTAATPAADAPAKSLTRDLSALESRISGLSLADADSYGHGPVKGVVLIAGGLGGPDAVRQLLGALPEGFPRPVLVRLQLDGGRYDRLVRQMERATAMPVQLAEAGMTLSPGEVYFLPPDLLPVATAGELRFAESADIAALADAVPADDSAVLFLSGADASLVDVAMGPAWQGALVGGQSEEGCYDPVAARAVAQRGGPAGSPTDIADWLLARWMPGARNFDSGGLSL